MNVSDRILICGIDCVAGIGVTPEERTIRQRLSIDVDLFTDTSIPARTDSLKDAIDYARVAATVETVCRERDYHLIETVAESIAGRVLSGFPLARVRVLVRKISPVAEPRVGHVAVEIVRDKPGSA
jgi:7,8-dihydroneopterin aldolase/epimerase/oxygenase